MADTVRYCPFCGATMTYDSATGIYTCPDCGFKEYNQILGSGDSSSSTTKG